MTLGKKEMAVSKGILPSAQSLSPPKSNAKKESEITWKKADKKLVQSIKRSLKDIKAGRIRKTKSKTHKFVVLNLQYPSAMLRWVANLAEKDGGEQLVKDCREHAMIMRFVLCTQKKNNFTNLFYVRKSEWTNFVREENKRLREGIL